MHADNADRTATNHASELTKLRPHAHERLTDLERTIDDGLNVFVRVGRALVEIRDERLYRLAGHATFAEYCTARWQITRPTAYRKIDAAYVVDLLLEAGIDDLPANEAQARELARLKNHPSLVLAAWNDATRSDTPGVTASAIRAVVDDKLSEHPDLRHNRSRKTPTRTISCPHCGHTWDR